MIVIVLRILDEKNQEIADKLRTVFVEWYTNGHTDEKDPNTIILRIRLTDGVLFSHGTRYDVIDRPKGMAHPRFSDFIYRNETVYMKVILIRRL